MEGLGIFADGELYAVDVTLVEKVVRNIAFTPVPAAPGAVAGIANMKGGIVTLLSLSELLGRKRSDKAVHAVVFKALTSGNDQMGLLIDQPDDLISIDDDDITPPHLSGSGSEVFFVTGLAEINDRLLRIIDLDLINRQYDHMMEG